MPAAVGGGLATLLSRVTRRQLRRRVAVVEFHLAVVYFRFGDNRGIHKRKKKKEKFIFYVFWGLIFVPLVVRGHFERFLDQYYWTFAVH